MSARAGLLRRLDGALRPLALMLLAVSTLPGRAACGPVPPSGGDVARDPGAPAGRLMPAGEMSSPRAAHTATLLPDGRVLVAGGCTADSCETGDDSATVEIYDPATGSFARSGRLAAPRSGHTATLLAGGQVLLAGGWAGPDPTASAEIWDPSARTSRPIAPMAARRGGHTATLLRDGTVLIAGGSDHARHLCDAERGDLRSGHGEIRADRKHGPRAAQARRGRAARRSGRGKQWRRRCR